MADWLTHTHEIPPLYVGSATSRPNASRLTHPRKALHRMANHSLRPCGRIYLWSLATIPPNPLKQTILVPLIFTVGVSRKILNSVSDSEYTTNQLYPTMDTMLGSKDLPPSFLFASH